MRKLLYESHNQQKQFNFISIIYMRYSYRIVCIKHWPFNHNPMEKKLLNCPMRIVKYQTNKWQMSRVAVVVLPTHLSFWRLRRDYWVITNSHTHTLTKDITVLDVSFLISFCRHCCELFRCFCFFFFETSNWKFNRCWKWCQVNYTVVFITNTQRSFKRNSDEHKTHFIKIFASNISKSIFC